MVRMEAYSGRKGLILAGIGLLVLVIASVWLLFGNQGPTGGEEDGTRPTRTLTSATPMALVARATATPFPSPTVPEAIIQQREELIRLGRGTITGLAVRPDGRILAVGGSLGVWLCDSKTLEPLVLLAGHSKPVTDVAWSADGRHVAAAGADGTVRVWRPWQEEDDSASGAKDEPIVVFEGHLGAVASVAWSPEGSRLASGGWDDTVRIWAISDGNVFPAGQELQVLSLHADAVIDLAWSPDGQRLASASRDQTVRVWSISEEGLDSVEQGAVAVEAAVLEGHDSAVTGIAWSPDGSRLASASEDETVRIWALAESDAQAPASRVEVGQAIVLEGHTSFVESVAWSLDGAELASGALDRTVRVWDAASGRETLVLKGHTQPVRGVIWLPDESGLLSGGDDGSLRRWDPANGTELQAVIEYQDEILSVTWSPDGSQLAWGSGAGVVEVWQLGRAALDAAEVITAPKRLYRLTGQQSEIHSVAWSPEGAQLASAGGVLDNSIFIWDLEKPGAARVVDGHSGTVRSIAWSPDGSRLASASWDNTVRLWDRAGRPLEVLKGHTDWALSISWAPEGRWLASDGKDGTVRIWETDGTLVLTLSGHSDQVTSVAWSPNGQQLASAGRDGLLRIWGLSFENGIQARVQLVFNTPGAMTSLAWSPDGGQLAMATEFRDDLVRIWDVHTGEELQALAGHVDRVKSVAWSADGRYLATAGADGTVRVWGIQVETGD